MDIEMTQEEAEWLGAGCEQFKKAKRVLEHLGLSTRITPIEAMAITNLMTDAADLSGTY